MPPTDLREQPAMSSRLAERGSGRGTTICQAILMYPKGLFCDYQWAAHRTYGPSVFPRALSFTTGWSPAKKSPPEIDPGQDTRRRLQALKRRQTEDGDVQSLFELKRSAARGGVLAPNRLVKSNDRRQRQGRVGNVNSHRAHRLPGLWGLCRGRTVGQSVNQRDLLPHHRKHDEDGKPVISCGDRDAVVKAGAMSPQVARSTQGSALIELE